MIFCFNFKYGFFTFNVDHLPGLHNNLYFIVFHCRFLHPPVTACLYCQQTLHVHHSWTFSKPPTQVKVHTVEGTDVYSKVAYRCRSCVGSNNLDITYHIGK